jgi:SsrA-binding protein
MAKDKKKNLTFVNKKAYHDYEILEKLECGLVLEGSEVKSIRDGKVNLKDGFVRIIKNELFLLNTHIANLTTTHSTYRPDERRSRKLLAHKKEIRKLFEKVTKDGVTMIPLKLYFNSKNIVKVQIGVARGKKLYDKREDLKRKTQERDMKIALKSF